MVLKVYYDLMSQPCRAVVMLLRKEGVKFEDKVMAIRKGEHRLPEHRGILPFAKVPAIHDTDHNLKLTESVAILKYICEQWKLPDHWYPRDLVKRAKVDEFCAWQHADTRYKSFRVFVNEVLAPGMFDGHGDIERELYRMMSNMERYFLKDTKFLAGDEISIADLLGVCELMQVTATGRDLFKNHPILDAWVNRVKTEMNPIFDDVHFMVYKIRAHRLKTKGKL